MTQPTDDQLAAAAQKARADHETAREIAARLLAPPEERARDLIAQLTAWLDAPRLAARETAEVVAEVVAEVEGFRLLRTTAGEWAVRWPCDDDDEIDWDTEVVARQNFKDITGIDTTGGGQ
jgi:hypothetical protein